MKYLALAALLLALAYIAWWLAFGQTFVVGMELRGTLNLTYDEFSRMW